MKDKITKIIKEELINYLIQNKKANITEIYSDDKEITLISKRIANLIETEYNSVLQLNDKKKYSNKINEVMILNNCNMYEAWDTVEDIRAQCNLEPIFSSINSLYNWRSRNTTKKDK